ncbi:sporulation protein [Bacillus sp. VT-16-64]|uniref:YhcN/YlaJ family sporulation lipoprotein n=1 Tax=Siminovitchia sp. FSL W7-1587 TaxID=2954699 RepID=UPI00097DCC69|nr:sporulation protein [Bacillus sp. VT-16-64]
MIPYTKKPFILIIFAFIFLTSCSYDGGKEHEKSDTALFKTTKPAPVELKKREEKDSIAYQVRKDVSKVDEIYDVAVLEGDKQIVVAYKVKHLNRFRMKSIEKKITDKLNKKYPGDDFIVSSDYKIFLETVRLKEDLDGANMSNEEAEKRFKKIIKLKKEMT